MQKFLKISNSLYKYLITAILISVPLYPKFPLFRIPGTYVSIRLEDFLIAITLVLFAIPLVKNFRKEVLKDLLSNKVLRSILIFLSIGLISLISGVYLTKTVVPSIGFLHLLRRIEYLSMFFVGFLYLKSNENKNFSEYLIKILLLVNLLVFLYGFGQKYFSLPVIITQNEEYSKGIALLWTPGSHINSTFAGHYDLASYLVLTIPIFIACFFTLKNKFTKIILVLSIGFGFWLFSSAVSRISIVSFVLASVITLFLLKKYKEILIIFLISALIFGFSVDLRVRFKRLIDVTLNKISTVQSIVMAADTEEIQVFEDRSTSIRFNVEWPRAIRAFIKNPLLGTGYSSINLATDNDYLRLLGELGLLGFFAFGLIFIHIFKSIKSLWPLEKHFEGFDLILITSLIGSTMGILLTAFFIDIFEASKFAIIFWLMMGLMIGRLNSPKRILN
jgi:O-antigen ligase